jgi:hypothetical protein
VEVRRVIGPNQERWLTELESGEWRQGRGVLFDYTGGYCCLGVAAELFGAKRREADNGTILFDQEVSLAPARVVKALALYDKLGSSRTGFYASLTTLNDDRRWSFAKIAATVRANPTRYFKEPR